MKIVNFNPVNEQKKKHKQELMDSLDEMKKAVESGDISEFVAATIGENGEIQVYTVIKDLIGGVGLFEIGKNILIDVKGQE